MTLPISPFREEHDALREAASRWATDAQPGDEPGATSLGLGSDDPWANVVVLEEAFRASRPLGRSLVGAATLPEELAAAVGACAAAGVEVDRASAYAREREAFGRPIAAFQVVKHMLVEMATALAACRQLVIQAVDEWQAGSTDDSVLGMVARAAATMDLEVADRSMQVHGGAGYSEEFPVGDAWLDARTARSTAANVVGADPGPRRRRDLPLMADAYDDLRSRARAFVAEHLTPHVEEWEAARDFPRELFEVTGKAGWFGHKFDPRWGGSGPDLLAEVAWIEELSRCGSGGVAADLGAHSQLASLYVARQGNDDHRDRWLRPSIAGEIVGGLGVTEPGAGSDVNGLTTRAVRDGGDWVINGAKMFITNGSWADYVVVAARTDPDAGHAGITLFVVEAGTPGFEQRRMKMVGWQTSHTGDLSFTDVRVPDDNRLTEEGRGFYAIMQNFAWERLMMSLGANVASEEALADAVRAASVQGDPGPWTRTFADRWGALAQAKALTEHALRLHVNNEGGDDVDQGELLRATAMSKLVTQRLAVSMCNLALDVRGAAATAHGHPVRRWLRDSRLGPIGGGTDEIMREIIAGTMGL